MLLPVASLLAAGCASTTPDTTSTVQGHLVMAGFPAGTNAVEATDELGARQRVALTADGAFRLDLHKSHRYAFTVVHVAGNEPIVFPRANGRLDRTVSILSGAAVVDLGAVRHFARAPAEGFVLKSAHASASGDGEDGECVDGFLMGTQTPCIDDDQDLTCENGDGDGECEDGVDKATGQPCVDTPDSGDGDGECENGVDKATGQPCVDAPDSGDGDGECEDGVDKATGRPCVDDDAKEADETDADPAQPMAVPERNPPDHVSGCNEGGEEADD